MAKKVKLDKPFEDEPVTKFEEIKSKQNMTGLSLEKKKKEKKVIRSWTGNGNNERPKIEETAEPTIVLKIRDDDNMSPVDL